MSPQDYVNLYRPSGVPRASGDEPRALELKIKLMECSPRERG